MIPGVAARAVVVSGESIVDVGGASDVAAIGIAINSENVDEARSNASRDNGDGILRANALWLEYLEKYLAEVREYADAATLKVRQVRKN